MRWIKPKAVNHHLFVHAGRRPARRPVRHEARAFDANVALVEIDVAAARCHALKTGWTGQQKVVKM
jgi:hypothetical protein